MPPPLPVAFAAGPAGAWRIDTIQPIRGDGLPPATHLAIFEGQHPSLPEAAWTLRGSTGNHRYTTRAELGALTEVQQGLGRPEATCAALIPIRKTEAWWSLAQDERRALLEEQSHHIAIGLDYLPPIARRLHHARELGEPFDFLTWFEFAPAHAADFAHLLQRLRATPEWRYIDREVEIRLTRAPLS